MHRGWVKLWRKIEDSPVWSMPPVYRDTWIWILIKVDYQTGHIKTSMNRIANGVSWVERGIERVPNRRTISKVLDYLQAENMITHESNRLFTEITVLNWDTYNSKETTKVTVDAQVNTQPNAQVNTHYSRSTSKNLKEVKPKTLSSDADLFGVSSESEEKDQSTNPNTFLQWVGSEYKKVPLTPYKRFLVPVKNLLTDRKRSNPDPQEELKTQFKRFMDGVVDAKFFGKDAHDLTTFFRFYPVLLENDQANSNGKAHTSNPIHCPVHGEMKRDNFNGILVYWCKKGAPDCKHTYRTEKQWTPNIQLWEAKLS